MTQNQLDPAVQKRLNEPLANPAGFTPENQQFLNLVLEKTESGKINLMQPSTLINNTLYDTLAPEKRGKVDFDAVNLATILRNIVNLWKYNPSPTYQMENLVAQVRLTKERLEEISGDVYVI